MIRVNQIKLPVSHNGEALEKKILHILQIRQEQLLSFEIVKRSIDGRKKPELFYVYTVDIKVEQETKILAKARKGKYKGQIMEYQPVTYRFPEAGNQVLENPPCIIGAGPAGLFAAYLLTILGYKPIVLERGKAVEERTADVERFWKEGILNPDSNVQFGEGGAGAFSDGKLNTVVKDPSGRNRFVLETFVRYGAQSDILIDAKPHIGTDVLAKVLVNMREDLKAKGCTFLFSHQVTDFLIENGSMKGLFVGDQLIPSEAVVLAPGHSARDTFHTLLDHEVTMEQKQFAVGFRVEHPQSMINECQYGSSYPEGLPAANYKVTSNFPGGRGVYSFCMCPGGYVVNSASADGQTVVNGMSYSGRDGANANSAIIVSVGPKDFGGEDPLAGVRYQEQLERRCYQLGQGKIPQQLYGDYCKNVVSKDYGAFSSTCKGESVFQNLRGLFSEEMEECFMAGMEHFGKIMDGFDRPDAILSGVESRTSSPVRIVRSDSLESNISGLYPCGEGAGYAGGIMSAAMDGLKVAEKIIEKYRVM